MKMAIAGVVVIACAMMQGTGAAATFESMGQPCRPKNILSADLIRDPKTGRETMLMCNTNEASGLELLLIDPLTNTGERFQSPGGQGAWLLRRIDGNRLVIGTHYDGKYVVFDLMQRKFIKTVQVPGEQYLWNSALGNDGRLYGGTYPGAVLAALDLKDYSLKTYPKPLNTNHQYLRYVNPTADGRLICTYGMADLTNMVFDPSTEKFTSAPAALKPLAQAVLWQGFLINKNEVYDGTSLEPVNPLPFPTPGEGWAVDTGLSTSETLYLRVSNRVFSYKKGDEAVKKVVEWDSRIPGMPRGLLEDGRLVCSLGQDYFLVSDDTTSVTLLPLPVESSGRPPHFIAADGRGHLWGGPQFGQTLFVQDLKTKQTTNTSIVSPRGGEVYDTEFIDGKVYAVAYVGGEVIEYDPSKPFDLFYGGNPKNIVSLDPDYIRPSAGVKLGADGLLYSGWLAKYGTYGGAIAITDVKKPRGKNNILIKNPLGEQGVTGVEVDARHIYVGTSLEANGMPPNPEGEPQVGILDKKTHKVLWSKKLGHASGAASGFVLDHKTGILAMRIGNKLALLDTGGQKFLTLDEPLMVVDGIAGDGKGTIFFGSGDDLVRFDLETRKVLERIKAPVKVEKISLDPATGITYMSGGADVFAVHW